MSASLFARAAALPAAPAARPLDPRRCLPVPYVSEQDHDGQPTISLTAVNADLRRRMLSVGQRRLCSLCGPPRGTGPGSSAGRRPRAAASTPTSRPPRLPARRRQPLPRHHPPPRPPRHRPPRHPRIRRRETRRLNTPNQPRLPHAVAQRNAGVPTCTVHRPRTVTYDDDETSMRQRGDSAAQQPIANIIPSPTHL